MRKIDPTQMTLLDLVSPTTCVCETCGGTILPPTIGGVARGSCHCSTAPARVKAVKSAPQECCTRVIATYEAIGGGELATVAKHRVTVLGYTPICLYCKACTARMVYDVDGKWTREGGL